MLWKQGIAAQLMLLSICCLAAVETKIHVGRSCEYLKLVDKLRESHANHLIPKTLRLRLFSACQSKLNKQAEGAESSLGFKSVSEMMALQRFAKDAQKSLYGGASSEPIPSATLSKAILDFVTSEMGTDKQTIVGNGLEEYEKNVNSRVGALCKKVLHAFTPILDAYRSSVGDIINRFTGSSSNWIEHEQYCRAIVDNLVSLTRDSFAKASSPEVAQDVPVGGGQIPQPQQISEPLVSGDVKEPTGPKEPKEVKEIKEFKEIKEVTEINQVGSTISSPTVIVQQNVQDGQSGMNNIAGDIAIGIIIEEAIHSIEADSHSDRTSESSGNSGVSDYSSDASGNSDSSWADSSSSGDSGSSWGNSDSSWGNSDSSSGYSGSSWGDSSYSSGDSGSSWGDSSYSSGDSGSYGGDSGGSW